MRRVIEGVISSPFGLRRDPINDLWRDHNGIDVAAAVGTPILSPTDGIVRGIYNHPAGGKTLIIISDDGKMRYGFCHLSKQIATIGQHVSKGDQIARSGNTGRTTGPHLHLTVKCGGEWVAKQIAPDGTTIEAHYLGGAFVDPTPFLEI